jgi:glutamine cyclotransferase
LYEGKSSLRKVEVQTGEVLQKIDLTSEYFGEGITIYENKIIQLTWQNKKGFVYDKNTFQLVEEFSYTAEGWGITYDGQYLIMSDGTDVLYYLNPADYSVVKQINVTANGEAVTRLNELEYINGRIYANVWQTDRIAIIQPDGTVIGWIDLEGILSYGECSTEIDVLNGIAYNPEKNSIYVTGKNWCKLFEIEFVP